MDEFETSESTELTDEQISAGWDDDVEVEDAEDDTETDTEAEQTGTEETEGENAEAETGETESEPEPGAESKAEDQRFVLKHLDTEKSVTLEELKSFAQKGLDYDRVKAQVDSYKRSENAHESFLKELADHDGVSVDDLIDSLRAGLIAETDGVSRDVALERAKRMSAEAKLAEAVKAGQKSEEEKAADEKRKADFVAFSKAHPETKAQDIPKEVWEKVSGGMSLTDAWDIYEAKTLREENKKLKDAVTVSEQKAKNAAKSTGSVNTSGKTPKAKNDIFAGWDDE